MLTISITQIYFERKKNTSMVIKDDIYSIQGDSNERDGQRLESGFRRYNSLLNIAIKISF